MRPLRHPLLAAILAFYAVLAALSPERLHALAEEDGCIEWLTFAFFGAAGVGFVLAGRREKGGSAWGLASLGLLCLAVAGEEISWGQRILGFIPAEPFLASNVQQEANLHNLLHALFRPKWLVVGLLSVWGGAGPLLARLGGERFGRLEPALRAAAAPADLAPWAFLGIALIVADPVPSTAEYIELLTGGLFYASCLPWQEGRGAPLIVTVLPAVLTAAGLAATALSVTADTAARRECAERELGALVDAVASQASTRKLTRKRLVHQRAFRAVRAGYVDATLAGSLAAVDCPGDRAASIRRRYLLDPWGQAYWLRYEDDRGAGNVVAYSFGPNRRRDSSQEDPHAGDDLRSPQRVIGAPR